MQRRVLLLGLVLAASIAAASPSPAIDIRELHKNTSSGVPNKFGNRFSVTGKVIVPENVRSTTNTEVAIQDSTGGMTLFELGGSGFPFALGDSITIEGEVAQFNGLTELINLSNYTLHTQGLPEPNPLVLTAAEINSTILISVPDSFPEYNESRFIRINDVSLVSGTWPTSCTGNSVLTIQDVTGTTTMFIDRDTELCGTPEPQGTFSVIGYLTQFDSSAPFSTGYQIVPRYITDIISNTPGPRITSGPEATNIDTTSALIVWETDTQSTSRVGVRDESRSGHGRGGLDAGYESQCPAHRSDAGHSLLLRRLSDGRGGHDRERREDVRHALEHAR